MDLMDLINAMSSSGVLQQIGNMANLPQNETGKVRDVAALTLPAMLQALNQNSSSPEGARSLYEALGQHRERNLDDLTDELQRTDEVDGAKILGHMFGRQTDRVEETVAQGTGLQNDQVKKIMVALAPLVLAYLSRQMEAKKLDSRGIDQETTRMVQQYEQRAPQGGLAMELAKGLLSGTMGQARTETRRTTGSMLGDIAGSLLSGQTQSQTRPSASPMADLAGSLIGQILGGR